MGKPVRVIPPGFIQNMDPLALHAMLHGASRGERKQISRYITPRQKRELKEYRSTHHGTKMGVDHGPLIAIVVIVVALVVFGGGYLLYLHTQNTPFFH